VHLLTDKQATTKNIKEQLNWIARHAGADDLVVIYVATHGTPRTVDSAGGANYLVTYDTEAHTGENFNEDALYATAYPMWSCQRRGHTHEGAANCRLPRHLLQWRCGSPGAPAPTEKLANTAPSKAMLTHMTLERDGL